MSSFYVDFKSRKPIYEQLIDNITNMVLRGVLAPNDPIPSVRQLASELGINPNTIHKAYAELERRCIIYSSTGRGSYVSDNVMDVREKKLTESKAQIKDLLREAKELGAEKGEIINIVNDLWDL